MRQWNGMDVQVPWRMDYGGAVATASNVLLASYEDSIAYADQHHSQIVDGGNFKAQLHQDALQREKFGLPPKGALSLVYTLVLPGTCVTFKLVTVVIG